MLHEKMPRHHVIVLELVSKELNHFYTFAVKYRIVASTNTCYCWENQIFLFFKVSNSNMPIIFFRKKTFSWCVCQVAGISKRSVNFYFLTPHVTNWIHPKSLIKGMGCRPLCYLQNLSIFTQKKVLFLKKKYAAC